VRDVLQRIVLSLVFGIDTARPQGFKFDETEAAKKEAELTAQKIVCLCVGMYGMSIA